MYCVYVKACEPLHGYIMDVIALARGWGRTSPGIASYHHCPPRGCRPRGSVVHDVVVTLDVPAVLDDARSSTSASAVVSQIVGSMGRS